MGETPLSQDEFDKFVEIYEVDMRGDKDLRNGNIGVINWLRQLIKFPSITWLLAHRPVPTITAIIVTHALLDWLEELGGKAWVLLTKYLL